MFDLKKYITEANDSLHEDQYIDPTKADPEAILNPDTDDSFETTKKLGGSVGIAEAASPKFDKAANAFLKATQTLIDAHMKKSFPTLPRKVLRFAKGRKYWRIEAVDQGQSSGYAWAFLNTENGDVLKPASFRAPAKHARGNIYDAHGGTKGVGPYGPAYLR